MKSRARSADDAAGAAFPHASDGLSCRLAAELVARVLLMPHGQRMKTRRRIEIRNESRTRLSLDQILLCIKTALDAHNARPGEVSVLLTLDPKMQELNLRFRGIDASTDVLTFPAPSTASAALGDIAISMDAAKKQARARKVRIVDETAMLAIHGALHLVGFDDKTEKESAAMLKKMNDVAKKCGIPTENEWSSLAHGEGKQ